VTRWGRFVYWRPDAQGRLWSTVWRYGCSPRMRVRVMTHRGERLPYADELEGALEEEAAAPRRRCRKSVGRSQEEIARLRARRRDHPGMRRR